MFSVVRLVRGLGTIYMPTQVQTVTTLPLPAAVLARGRARARRRTVTTRRQVYTMVGDTRGVVSCTLESRLYTTALREHLLTAVA